MLTENKNCNNLKIPDSTYELWFRLPYQNGFENKSIRSAVRPGDRRFPMPKGTRVGDIARIRIIEIPGSEEHNIKPIFNNFKSCVKVSNLVVKRIGELSADDLKFASEDSRTPKEVRKHLEKIYGKKFGNRDIVTVIHWAYV